MSRASDQPNRELNAAISAGVVHLLREHTGRGPTKARTIIGDNVIVCVVEDALTVGERNLVRDGEAPVVLETRRAFQRSMEPAYVGVVEELSGREVSAFMSDNHLASNSAVEVFLLTPLS